MRSAFASWFTVLSVAAAGCGPGLDPEFVVHAPVPTKASSSAGAASVDACAIGASEPLTVDWLPTQRSDLDDVMREGIAIVSYDCRGLKLLKSCKLQGSYAFAGATPSERALQLSTPIELQANVPFSGPGLKGEVERGGAIDVGFVSIGRRSAPLTDVALADLTGACDGATHAVRGAWIGAFAMATGAKGKPRSLQQLAEATGQAGISGKEGDPLVCRGAKVDAALPPVACQSIIRLDLLPIAARRQARAEQTAAPRDDGHALANPCPPGTVLSGVKCGAPSGPHLCSPDDGRDCEKQCNGGDAGSCYHLAYHYLSGKDLARDDVKAAALLDKACAAGVARACFGRAELYARAVTSAKDQAAKADDRAKARELSNKACELGDGWACAAAAEWYLQDGAQAVLPKDPARAVALLRRSCHLGQSASCGAVAAMQIEGKQTAKDAPGAASLLQRACEGGAVEECVALGDLHRKGQGIAKDGQKAVAAYARGCALGLLRACGAAGSVYLEGDGVPKDITKAYGLFEKGCPDKGFAPEACMSLASMHDKGTGIPRDTARAAALYERVCAMGGCARAAELWRKGDGVKADPDRAFALYEAGCTKWSDKKACDALGPLLEAKDKGRAKAHYEGLCSRTQDKAACASLKRLGGAPAAPPK